MAEFSRDRGASLAPRTTSTRAPGAMPGSSTSVRRVVTPPIRHTVVLPDAVARSSSESQCGGAPWEEDQTGVGEWLWPTGPAPGVN